MNPTGSPAQDVRGDLGCRDLVPIVLLEGVVEREEEPRPPWVKDSALPGMQRTESQDLSLEQPHLDMDKEELWNYGRIKRTFQVTPACC